MHSNRPTLRELVIGLGLLRPSDAAEKHAAHQKCTTYLHYRMCCSSSIHSALDHQLVIAVLERWLAL